ncbi:MAG: RNA-binding protein [Mariprofundaceae bacterium]
MSFSCFIKLAIGAAILAVVGFFAEKTFGLSALMPISSFFATGLFLGAIIGGVATALYPSFGGSGSSDIGTIYVGNLPFSATKEEIEDLFRPYGAVHTVRLVTGPNRRPKGYGFVEMDSEGAKDAVKLNGVDMGGRKLRINKATEKDR